MDPELESKPRKQSSTQGHKPSGFVSVAGTTSGSTNTNSNNSKSPVRRGSRSSLVIPAVVDPRTGTSPSHSRSSIDVRYSQQPDSSRAPFSRHFPGNRSSSASPRPRTLSAEDLNLYLNGYSRNRSSPVGIQRIQYTQQRKDLSASQKLIQELEEANNELETIGDVAAKISTLAMSPEEGRLPGCMKDVVLVASPKSEKRRVLSASAIMGSPRQNRFYIKPNPPRHAQAVNPIIPVSNERAVTPPDKISQWGHKRTGSSSAFCSPAC